MTTEVFKETIAGMCESVEKDPDFKSRAEQDLVRFYEETDEEDEQHQADIFLLNHPRSTYPAQTKIAAAVTYMMSGSVKGTADAVGVDKRIICDWRDKAPWWKDVIDTARKRKNEELDAHMTNCIHGAMQELTGRLSKGDPYVAKDGSIQWIPLKTKDLAVTTAIIFDKRALLRGEATAISYNKGGSLKDLESKFRSFAQKMEQERVSNQKVVSSDNTTFVIEKGQ